MAKASTAKESQWYDVGIVKVTNMVVTHYYMPFGNKVVDVSILIHKRPSTPER